MVVTTTKTAAPAASPKPAATTAPAPAAKAGSRQEAADAAAKKASEVATKAEQEAHVKAGEINSRLAKAGDAKRIGGSVREGKPVYWWGNFVPTRELTEEELALVEAL